MRLTRQQVVVASVLLGPVLVLAKAPRKRPYRLPDVDIKQRVIWGATCDGPGGAAVAFGGQDQQSEDGRPHTRITLGGRWRAIHEQLRTANPLQKLHDRLRAVRDLQKNAAALARSVYFKGLPPDREARRVRTELVPAQKNVVAQIAGLIAALRKEPRLGAYPAAQRDRALGRLTSAHRDASDLAGKLAGITPAAIRRMADVTIRLEKAAEHLDAEPPPRALSPLVYEPRSKLYVLFGGDHLDYLTNDTWVFDPAKQQWRQRRPPSGPPPRANHKLSADGGRITLTGGYTYSSNTDYCGGQYIDLDDGPWSYDVIADRWTGAGTALRGDTRVYRTGPFHPEFYLRGDRPDAAATGKRLAALPANTWVAMNPPHLPRLNRDWGSAVIDSHRDLMLRFSGGHSAHGGTDVLHYHFSTNRWELPFPVEFPLGQLYANTRYPAGYNFNRRPWVTGHTYQNYGYDPVARKMLFAGRTKHCYLWDPDVADWVARHPKPAGMVYNSCFYTITVCTTPGGAVAWTKDGGVFRFDAKAGRWTELRLSGVKLPGAVVDNSTVVYDSKRHRLLFASKGYGRKHTYDGQLYCLDLKTAVVTALSPGGMAAAGAIPYLCQIRYDAGNDLLLVGATLPAGRDGRRRTPACDLAANRWISLAIGGKDPSGPKGRNVSLGLMYDVQRKLFWAVDTNSKVYALRLDRKTADPQPLRKK